MRERPLVIRVGTSFIDADHAILALDREVGDASFRDVAASARREWNRQLGRIRVSGLSDSQRTVFYTALYRSLLFPRALHEIDAEGRLVHRSPYDDKVHPGLLYSDFGLWDTYRTLFPLYGLVYPERYQRILRGLLNAAAEGGGFPKWASPAYRNGMPGTQSEVLFADAWVKGLRDFDLPRVYDISRRSGLVPGNTRFGRVGLAAYDSLGFVPAAF
ncbi:MAG: glycoside hydrolase domain-containing protein [Candidatus Latescibacterota bacterium]